jgi:hypothetical protein
MRDKSYLPEHIVDVCKRYKAKFADTTTAYSFALGASPVCPDGVDTDNCGMADTGFAMFYSAGEGQAQPEAGATHVPFKWSDLNEKEREEAMAARKKELDTYEKFDTFIRVPFQDVATRGIPTKWVETRKLKDGVRIFKARLVARGDLDHRQDLDTKTGSCTHEGIRFCLLASMGSPTWCPQQALQLDVKSAYLQADVLEGQQIYLRPPKGHPDHGVFLWLLKKAVYGLPDAGRLFELKQYTVLRELGYERTIYDGIWSLTDNHINLGNVGVYVDDGAFMAVYGNAYDMTAAYQAKLECTPPEILNRFVGVDYRVSQDKIECSQAAYADAVEADPGTVPLQPLPRDINGETDESESLDATATTKFRALLGSLAYVATQTFPACAFAAAWLSRFSAKPTVRAMRLLHGAVRYMKAHIADNPLILHPPTNPRSIELVAYVDASLGGPVQPNGTTGIIVTVGGIPVSWVSHKQQRVSYSSEKAEFIALSEGTDRLTYQQQFLKGIFQHVSATLLTDAQNVLHLLGSDHPRPAEKALIAEIWRLGDKTLVVPALAVAHAIEDARVKLAKVGTKDNLADGLTKPMDVSAILAAARGHPPSSRGDAISVAPYAYPHAAGTEEKTDLNVPNRWVRDGISLRSIIKPPQRFASEYAQ